MGNEKQQETTQIEQVPLRIGKWRDPELGDLKQELRLP